MTFADCLSKILGKRHRRAGLPASVGLLVLAGLLAACGQPFVDSRREAGSTATVGTSTPDAPVVCYAKGETTPQEVGAMAQAVCARSGRVARFDGEDVMHCRLMQPWRARFTCVAPGSAGAGTLPPGPPGPPGPPRRAGRTPIPPQAPVVPGAGAEPGPGPGPGPGRIDTDGALYPGGVLPEMPRF
jgi:hypothetical protein